MSNFRVQQAVAAALTLGSVAIASAAQVDITTVPVANVLYVSGSTAIDPAMSSYWITGATAPCSTVTTDPAPTFYASTQTGKKFQAVACTASAALVSASGGTIAAGTSIAMIKEDNGGSQFGIDPVRDNTGLALTGQTVVSFYPDITTLTAGGNCAALAVAPASTACTGAFGTVSQAPNLGFADVDAAMFQDSLTGTGGTATQFNTIIIPFGVAVNLGLYHELQTLEATSLGLTVGSDSANSMPILTKDQLTAVFTGQVGNWTTLFPGIATTAVTWGTTGGTQFNAGSAAPAGTTVYLCQRGQSSGTERTAEIFFTNGNCASGINKLNFAGVLPASCQADGCSWSTAFNNDKNFAGNGTGDLLTCLQGQDKVGHLAIGFASIDNGWGTFQSNTARRDFRYIRYNDAVPSIENAASGLYAYWAQSIGVIPPSGAGNFPSGVAGALATFVNSGANRIGSSTSLANLNATHSYQNTGVAATQWDGGILGIPESGVNTPNPSAATLATFQANPVASASKFSGTATNNCNLPSATSLTDTNSSPAWQAPAQF